MVIPVFNPPLLLTTSLSLILLGFIVSNLPSVAAWEWPLLPYSYYVLAGFLAHGFAPQLPSPLISSTCLTLSILKEKLIHMIFTMPSITKATTLVYSTQRLYQTIIMYLLFADKLIDCRIIMTSSCQYHRCGISNF